MRKQFEAKNRKQANRLRMLSDEWDNLPMVALKMGWSPMLFSPKLRELFQPVAVGPTWWASVVRHASCPSGRAQGPQAVGD